MIKDITIGQYYNADSYIHRLDSRVKLLGTLVYVVTLFFSKSPITYGVAAAALMAIIRISSVPFSFVVRGLKTLAVILFFTAAINIFFVPGDVVASFWVLSITRQGIVTAVYLGARLIMLIIGTSLMTFTTTPNELTDGLEKSLGFLNKIRIPVHEIAMMMSIALRFIPILTEELDKIMKAQTARGIDFENGSFFHKMKNMAPIIVPLFVAAVRRANDLALAMESRCYHGGSGRTKMKPLAYEKRDYIAYGILVIYLGLMIYLAQFNNALALLLRTARKLC